MHIYFYFCATTVNIPLGSYTPQNYSHGALGLLMQQINIFYFLLFSFSNAMLMQKSKYAKVK
jgi:hypothetical protein